MPVNLIPGEFSPFTIAVAILSGFIVFFGYVSMFLKERLFLSEAFVALIVGIIAGPLVSNGVNPYGWENNDEITKQLTRCIIAIQVMAVGIDLPKHYLKKEWLTMFMLMIPVMLFMWLISGLIIFLLVPPINYLESLVIAACICPTDPILANSVVKGRFAEKHVPGHIRNALSAESGANDGMGFPFLFLAIFLLGEDHVGKAVGKWIYETCLFQIALSCVIGVIVGWIARKILQWSERHHLIDKPSFLSFAIALALFLMSMTGFSGSDDVLACFAAGNAFSWDDWFRKETEEAHFQEVIDMLLNLSIFVYIGAIIPWWSFADASLGLTPWRLVVIAILVLLFRRLPIVLMLKPVMPAMKTYREAIFSGWFGPMGVGAVFLSKIAKEEMEQVYPPVAGQELAVSIRLINPVVLFIVLASVLVHGTTIPLFKLGKRLRTRTLSFASTGSNPKKLPKFHKHARRQQSGHENISFQSSMSMSETERNTLYNTVDRRAGQRGDNSSGETTLQQPPEFSTIDIHDPDLAEEEFLPRDHHGASSESSSGSSRSCHQNHQHDDHHSNGSDSFSDEQFAPPVMQDRRQRAATDPAASLTAAERKEGRTGSMPSLESQGIRFVEPVKPRASSQAMTESNDKGNDSTVSSMRSWINWHGSGRHPRDNDSNGSASPPSEQEAAGDRAADEGLQTYRHPSQHPPPHFHQPSPSHKRSNDFFRLFRGRHKDDALREVDRLVEQQQQQQQVRHTVTAPHHDASAAELVDDARDDTNTPSGRHPEVWEENGKLVIEDPNDNVPPELVDTARTGWRRRATKKIKHIEDMMHPKHAHHNNNSDPAAGPSTSGS